MKQKLLIVAFLAAVQPVKAQIDTVLFESLTNRFTIPTEKDYIEFNEQPKGFEDWNFDNCWAIKEDDKSYFQVCSTKKTGSITTRSLQRKDKYKGLKGNGRITFTMKFKDADQYKNNSIQYRVIGDGILHQQSYTGIKTQALMRLPNIVLRGGNEQTKLKFYSADKDGNSAIKKFYIENILVCDMGKDIYAETFDRLNGTGGNDKNYNISLTNADYLTFDYNTSNIALVKKAYKCIALYGSPASYITGQIPFYNNSSRNGILSFKVAGATGCNKELRIQSGDEVLRTITPTEQTWETIEIPFSNLETSKIEFYGEDCFLDNIRIRETASTNATFSDQATNASALLSAYGKVVNATLTRTLTKDIWNTLCLPFDFNTYYLPDDLKDAGVEVQRLISVDDGIFRFTPSTNVPAGEPFLIRVSETVSNPTFSDVPVLLSDNSEPKMNGSFGMAGCLYKHELATNGTHLFLGTDGLLHEPTEEDHVINGLRAYFIVPEGSSARVALGNEEMHIDDHRLSLPTSTQLYNLMGMPIESAHATRGIYIRNGKKIIIK